MVRPVTEDDTGLRVLRPAPDGESIVDIVAIHGLGAHPDDTWSRRRNGESEYVNWLSDPRMLPQAVPNARIMRYGYESGWFGKQQIKSRTSTVAKRLLIALRRERKASTKRPLIFIAHCFGGLVVLKALLDAQEGDTEFPGVVSSTVGIVFFGTPFRGARGLNQVELLDAARREYDDSEIDAETLHVLQPGDEFLQDLVDRFTKTRARMMKSCKVACFFELKESNVGRIVGKEDKMRFVVDESSGCLDSSNMTEKYSLSRTHFDMNKFAHPNEEDYLTVSDVLENYADLQDV
ncbi:hypothetical protein GQ44DRAFT_158670 [Phaeosphaeriaceae sp. PMI808]|nr:hypothetical protein GQ44DRAFT_158670 [Phaeosphaeriaceae sp. PMI808]